MKAWYLRQVSDLRQTNDPLSPGEAPLPAPAPGEILIRVSCCGICHTELDEIEGRTPPPQYPVIPGHQVVGYVERCGSGAARFRPGDRVGVGWICSACGRCEYCRSGMENLCQSFTATGRDRDGGYAEFMTVDERFAYAVPSIFSDAEAAPLLCAGAIGFRSLKLANLSDGQTLALAGFGASGHLVLKMAHHLYPTSPIFVFARSREEQAFALQLGAAWAGDFSQAPPAKANAIIDTTPVWSTITASLLHLKPGGRLAINAIRKESQDAAVLSTLRYHDHLWMEKEIKSVANITRQDIEEFFNVAASIPIRPEVEVYPFEDANRALVELKHKHVRGAKVLRVATNKNL